MIKYTPSSQLTLAGFSHPFSQELSLDNRWVKLAALIPWDSLAAVYARSLNNTSGRESIDVRMVIGALIIKHKLGLDDRGTVEMISENIYLQYFCGLPSFQSKLPFHPTVFVDIRKRMGRADFDKWNGSIIEKADGLRPKREQVINKTDSDNKPTNNDCPSKGHSGEGHPNNRGTLKIDATVADQKIVYPTDVDLLNTAREQTERMIDLLYKASGVDTKPRDHRRVARKAYLGFSKKKKKTKRCIRKQLRQQLGYLKRNIGHVERLLDHMTHLTSDQAWPLGKRDQRLYWAIQHLYQQQKYMYERRVNSVANRIVNIYQPYVRPIPRGKSKVNTEFGAKISASEVDGMTRVEHIGWENFNESQDLELQVETFYKTYGHYPGLLLADRIYLNRKNRKWLKEKGIRIVGKPLGRPAKQQPSAYQKRKQKKEQNQRNHIEGKFGQGKNAYGLNNIKAKRKDTSESWISCIFFVMNLVSLLKIAEKYAVFCAAFYRRLKGIFEIIGRLPFDVNIKAINLKQKLKIASP